jgi:hypothetical protein
MVDHSVGLGHLVVVSPSAMKKGVALFKVISKEDHAAPFATLLTIKKDDRHHDFGQAPMPLLSASLAMPFSI